MSYLNETAPEPGCIFCAKIREDRDEQNYIVHRGERCFVILNLYPYNSGHLLIVPYQHTGDLAALPVETGADIFATAQHAIQALGNVMHPDGFNLGVNQGEAAGAGIADHVHLHIVPRWSGDTNFMPVLADAKVIPELLSATAAKLRPEFQDQNCAE
ncbi:MAG TPA: HIT domain-containing protein [Chloroflexota bacterium]